MRTIFKYHVRFNRGEPVKLNVKLGARILHVGTHQGEVHFWAEVTVDAGYTSREFIVLGTGRDIPDRFDHRGSCVDEAQGFAWHLYERRA